MSSQTADGVKAELDIKVAERIAADATLTSSIADVASGTTPLSQIIVSGLPTSGTAVLTVTGRTTLSADAIMTTNIVSGASTSLTTAGFLRIAIVDSAGNATDGSYYIPFGTLS